VSNPYAPPSGGRDGARGPDPHPPGAARRAAEPHGPPEPRPAPEPTNPPDPEAQQAATRQVLHFALLLLATLLTSSLPLPWQVAGLVLAIAAIVVGVRAMISIIRLKLRTALAPALGIGLGVAVTMVFSLAVTLAVWPLQVERQECLAGALTIAAHDACEAAFQDALTERLQGSTAP